MKPEDFLDLEEMFGDEEPPEEITHASFTIIPGDNVNHASLVYWANGVEGTRMNWGLSMYYGYRYNGPDIPIGDSQAKRILENLVGAGEELEDIDSDTNWVYVE